MLSYDGGLFQVTEKVDVVETVHRGEGRWMKDYPVLVHVCCIKQWSRRSGGSYSVVTRIY